MRCAIVNRRHAGEKIFKQYWTFPPVGQETSAYSGAFHALDDDPRRRPGFLSSGKSKLSLVICRVRRHFSGISQRRYRSLQGRRF